MTDPKESNPKAYRYQYVLEAPGVKMDQYGDVDKGEIQKYINEMLGVKKAKNPPSERFP